MIPIFVTLAAAPASAHRPGLSTATLEADHLTLTLESSEWAVLSPNWEATSSQLLVDGQPCALGAPVVSPAVPDGVNVLLSADCAAGSAWTYQAGFLSSLPAGHRHVVQFDGETVAVLDAANTEIGFDAESASSTVAVAGEFIGLGVEHILIGFDHLAFLLALLLVARTAKQMMGIITGFTIAHSITLSVAALGWITPPDQIVEAAIAASICYAGIENLAKPSAKRRFILTFALGLIHGFGFAGVLRELGLPAENLLVALLSFNVGVELGQLALFSLAFPVLIWLSQRWEPWSRVAVPALSVIIAMIGGYWTLERLFL